jgi:hypothetical protein
MLRPCLRVAVLSAIILSALLGNWNDTSTGINLAKLPRFPLTKVRSGWLQAAARVKFESISALSESGDEREVQLRGAGKSGKRWEAHLFGLDEVWRADLDGNGTQDYILFTGGPYFNGRTTPLFSLSILLMDAEGMPTPFFTVVYHGENGDGIKHLVDMNHDGHAELLIAMYDENPSDPRMGAFSSGHWTNQLYRFKDLGAEEIRGTIGGITFPFVHSWTYAGTDLASPGPPFLEIRPARLHNFGTSPRQSVITTIRKLRDANGLLTIDPIAGCTAVRTGVVVYDRPQIREIAFPNQFGDYEARLTDRIRHDGAHVELRGIDKAPGNGECSVNLMWAK